MKYTREELIKSIEMLVDTCNEAGNDCEGCPFRKDRETNPFHDYRECIFKGESPLDWMDIDVLKGINYAIDSKSEKSEKRIVPFDFSLKEDRDAIIRKRIWSERYQREIIVSFIYKLEDPDIWGIDFGLTPNELLKFFVFADGPNEGKPVGKEVEECDRKMLEDCVKECESENGVGEEI